MGRQRHSLKRQARAEHRGNHHHQRPLPLLLSLAPNSSGGSRRIMNAIPLIMLWTSVPGMAPVWVGSGCFPISSSLHFSEHYDLMWSERRLCSSSLQMICIYLFVRLPVIIILISYKSVGPFLRLCATPTCSHHLTVVSMATSEGDLWSCDVTRELDSQPMKS